jgi:Endoplasmic reticulum vesicle transporter/Thioredoxin
VLPYSDKRSWSIEEWEHALKIAVPIQIAKVDCTKYHDLCRKLNIRAYPTLRLFIDGKHEEDYQNHRTIIEMTDWLHAKEERHEANDMNKNPKSAGNAVKQAARSRLQTSAEEDEWRHEIDRHKSFKARGKHFIDEEHPGCQIHGWIMVDRVPGNFHIQARSNHHELVSHMTNLSHIVHHLSMGEPMANRLIENGKTDVPDSVQAKFTPMRDNVYLTTGLHEAYHHYLKVVTTDIEGLASARGRKLKAYQIVQSSQLTIYHEDEIPEAKFIYDLSPIAVQYRKEGRHWYDYMTSVMAIIGGAFTVLSILDTGMQSSLYGSRTFGRRNR